MVDKTTDPKQTVKPKKPEMIEFIKPHTLNEKEYKRGDKIKVYLTLFERLVNEEKVAKPTTGATDANTTKG